MSTVTLISMVMMFTVYEIFPPVMNSHFTIKNSLLRNQTARFKIKDSVPGADNKSHLDIVVREVEQQMMTYQVEEHVCVFVISSFCRLS